MKKSWFAALVLLADVCLVRAQGVAPVKDTPSSRETLEVVLPMPQQTEPAPRVPFFRNLLTSRCAPAADDGPALRTPEVVAKLPPGTVSPAELTAAKIKAEENGVSACRAAARYLGTVDWHNYPEAEAALVATVRADRNELVRLDAVISLGNGSRCNQKTLDALKLVLSGSESDGNPAETSDRVKAAARASLQQILNHGVPASATPAPQYFPQTARTGAPLQVNANQNQACQKTTSGSLPITQAEFTFAENFGAPTTLPSRPESRSTFGQFLAKAFSWTEAIEWPGSSNSGTRSNGLTPIGIVPGEQ
jgi:hypothetical protein